MLSTYDFKEVSCSWNGQIATGFAEGDDAITVEQDTEQWGLQIGADGEGSRSRMNNNAGKVTLRLMAGSPFNDVLNASYQADRVSGGGKGALFIKDGSGRSLHTVAEGWIEKLPNASYGAQSGTREWVIRTANIVSTIGGGN